MATATSAVKHISFGNLLATVFQTQLRGLITAKKTIILGIVMLLPLFGAGLFVYFNEDGTGGIEAYKSLVEYVQVTFLLQCVKKQIVDFYRKKELHLVETVTVLNILKAKWYLVRHR